MTFLVFLKSHSPNMVQFCWVFTRSSIQAEKKFVSKLKFSQKTDVSTVCTFGLTLTPSFSLKMVEIKKSIFSRKNFSYQAIQICENQGPIPLSFPGKILLFFLFQLSFVKKGCCCNIAIPGHLPVKKCGSRTDHKVCFSKILSRIFKFGCFSRYHTQSFNTNEFDILMQNLKIYSVWF